MKFAINYSPAAAELIRAGKIETDYFKCPAWRDRISEFQQLRPIYLHLPLTIGRGIGDAINSETKQIADWRAIGLLVEQTKTPFVNLHFAPSRKDFPSIPADSTDAQHIELLIESAIKDVESVVRRFGKDVVMVENDNGSEGQLHACVLPDLIRRVIEDCGCGFLFDLSHARLAAIKLGTDVQEYIRALPVERTREIHVTGLQYFEGEWVERIERTGLGADFIKQYQGRLMDHLPMTDADWEFFVWAMLQVRSGAWGNPWIVSSEYGGVGPLWEAITKKDVLEEQVPKLYALVAR